MRTEGYSLLCSPSVSFFPLFLHSLLLRCVQHAPGAPAAVRSSYFSSFWHQLILSTKESSASSDALRPQWSTFTCPITSEPMETLRGCASQSADPLRFGQSRLAAIGDCYCGVAFLLSESCVILHMISIVHMQLPGRLLFRLDKMEKQTDTTSYSALQNIYPLNLQQKNPPYFIMTFFLGWSL